MSRRLLHEVDPALLAPVINLHHDPFSPHKHRCYEAAPGELLIDWLQAHYPDGFGGPLVIHRNGRRVEIADADFAMERGDVVHLMVQPGDAITASLILYAVASAVISAAITMGLQLILGKPKGLKAHDQDAPDPIYSITTAQNAARVGEPVPALYGRMVTVPDYAAQPYTFFQNNEMYLDQILVIGQGEYELHDVQVGETPVSALEGNAVQYWQIGPAQHAQHMGNVRALTGVMENVVSSPEVGDQELSGRPIGDVIDTKEHFVFASPDEIRQVQFPPPAGYALFQVNGTKKNDGYYTLASYDGATPGTISTVEQTIVGETPDDETTLTWFHSLDQLAVGPFITSKPGALGDQILIDVIFPAGLYTADKDTGDLEDTTVRFNVEYQPVDADGNPTGAYVSVPYAVTERLNTPQRRTFVLNVPIGRYRVRVKRLTPTPSNIRTSNTMIWSGMRFRLVDSVTPVYGPVTLLVMRIRATNGITSAASSRVRAEVTRKLPAMGTGPLVSTRSPADAFIDVYTNPVYGAARPLTELDIAEIQRLSDHWGGQARFDGGFAQKSTVWEALTVTLQTAACSPLPVGQVMSLVQDGVKAIRTQLFSDANMMSGSLQVGYSFDKPGDNDGIEVEYRDPDTFNALYLRWPVSSLNPERVQLFGCTDPVQAEGFARLLWNKQKRLRRTARFDTELEGLLARRGDRVGIATRLPRWGAAGIVVRAAVPDLVLDGDLDWSGSGHFVILRNEFGEPSEPIPVTQGPRPNMLALAAPPPFALYGTGSQEPTHYAFGSSTELLRDFTITNMDPRGGTLVGIEAVIYDPAVYTGTLPWMEVPI